MKGQIMDKKIIVLLSGCILAVFCWLDAEMMK